MHEQTKLIVMSVAFAAVFSSTSSFSSSIVRLTRDARDAAWIVSHFQQNDLNALCIVMPRRKCANGRAEVGEKCVRNSICIIDSLSSS